MIKVNSSTNENVKTKGLLHWHTHFPTSCMAYPCSPSPTCSVHADSINKYNNVSFNNKKINPVSFHQTVTACFSFSLSLFLDLPLFFSLLSVQTATHSPAQSEWGSYADHFFHLSSPPLPLPLLRLWKVCLSFHLFFSHVSAVSLSLGR